MTTVHDATLAFLDQHRAARVDAITDRLVETIVSVNANYAASSTVTHDDLRRSCHDNIDRVLEILRAAVAQEGLPDEDDPVYGAARETGRRRAEQGLPLDDVLRSYRMGGRLIWDDLVEVGDTALDALAVREIGTRLWEVVDATSAQVATAYHHQELTLVRADEQQRAELWEGVLGGRAREPGFAREAALLLDLPADADLLVVVATELRLRLAEQALGLHATAWVRRTADVVGLVALRDDSPAEALHALERLSSETDGALGVSSVVPGLSGVEHGYVQASLALRAQGKGVGLARFDDRLPEALLLGSPEVASRLVERWLGPVLALVPGESRALIDTLGAWVASGGSATRTAAVVHCHRNTVANRLHRFTEVTGHRLSDDAVPVDLDLALRAWRLRLAR
ncbi:helix-turn-helix domain-containing protein [Nocardioides sp.]|uniref:PucR family transcriptional regulator n=1 Tax=Nocardioides sp. TaxID=35761 RepID=UPI00263177BB|nr:helix-turn-helix domain-containing protein [Nocardioides sp.]